MVEVSTYRNVVKVYCEIRSWNLDYDILDVCQKYLQYYSTSFCKDFILPYHIWFAITLYALLKLIRRVIAFEKCCTKKNMHKLKTVYTKRKFLS